MSDKLEEEINLYDKIIVKNYNNLSLAEQFEKCAVVKVDDELDKVKQQLAIAVKSLSTITNCAPACFQTEECPLEGGYGFDNGCFRCGYATAFEALQQIKELEK